MSAQGKGQEGLLALRLAVTNEIGDLIAKGVRRRAACVSAGLAHGVSRRIDGGWWSLVEHAPRETWPELLAPKIQGAQRARIDSRSWNAFLVLYLSFDRPTLKASYATTQAVCELRGWPLLPHFSTVRRHLLDVPGHVVTLARKGMLGLRARVALAHDREQICRNAERYLVELRAAHHRDAA